jgi:hypothetical protein
MRIAGRQAISGQGAPTGAKAGWHESQALDPYVRVYEIDCRGRPTASIAVTPGPFTSLSA